jgi:hypothetical protein
MSALLYVIVWWMKRKDELQQSLNLNTCSRFAVNYPGSGVARQLTSDRNNTGAQQTAGEASTDDQPFS